MGVISVTDVRVLPGDSGFLLDDGKTSILYDTGFGFTGESMAGKIQKLLGGRKLDYIFLSHSHYDHVLGAPYIQKCYPDVRVVAGEYVQRIFAKASARETMRTLDRKFAATCGVQEYEDLVDSLRVDIPVKDGDVVTCGELEFEVIALPGHTKCSIGFYLAEQKFFLSPETLGVYFGRDTYMPSYLVGYQMTLDSFARAREIQIDRMVIPHYGEVHGEETAAFLAGSEQTARNFARDLREIFARGGTDEEAMAYCRKNIYREFVQETYPIDAFLLNSSIMIALIRKESSIERQIVV